jgi:hypothetical protein
VITFVTRNNKTLNIKYNKKNNWFEISWEDEEGDNEVNVYSLDEKIHVNSDEWSYGIYKPQTI